MHRAAGLASSNNDLTAFRRMPRRKLRWQERDCMATRAERVADFRTDQEPQSGFEVELLCEDHNGTYVLPFPCRRVNGAWLNTKTGEDLQAEVIGWREWAPRHAGRPRDA